MLGRPRCTVRLNITRLTVIVVLMIIAGSASCQAQSEALSRAVVAADHPAASEAGALMLRQGGNAVDAAVATSFALSVVRPASCGIGGGGFMVIWDEKRGQSVALDYRERAPELATADRFANAESDAADEPFSVRGGLAVGVPGQFAACAMLRRSTGHFHCRRCYSQRSNCVEKASKRMNMILMFSHRRWRSFVNAKIT